jgi:ribosomal protein L20
MSEDHAVGEIVEMEYSDEIGTHYGTIRCPKCEQEVSVRPMEDRPKCRCGTEWDFDVSAVGTLSHSSCEADQPAAWAAGSLASRWIQVFATKKQAENAAMEAAIGIASQELEVFAICRQLTQSPGDNAKQSSPPRCYADARLVERAFRDLIEKVNEASRAHTMNYTGLLYALLLKGVIAPEELEAAREKAKAVVDKLFGQTPEAKKAEAVDELLMTLQGKE